MDVIMKGRASFWALMTCFCSRKVKPKTSKDVLPKMLAKNQDIFWITKMKFDSGILPRMMPVSPFVERKNIVSMANADAPFIRFESMR